MIPLLALFLACGGDPADTGGPQGPVLEAANAGDYLDRALAMMEGARDRLHVVQFEIYDNGSVSLLVDALVAARARGVQVALLADEEVSGTPPAVADLQARGVDARLDSPDRTTHNKLIVADSSVLVGSTNWSDSSIDRNNEANLYVGDPTVADWYESYFQALWADSSVQPSIPWEGGGTLTPWSNPQTADGLLACIGGATAEIAVVMYAMMYYEGDTDSTPTALVEALVEAHQRGVQVKVLLDRSEWIRENDINDASSSRLQEAGVEVRFSPPEEITHAKLLTCDGQVFLGDANWSTSGLLSYQGTSISVEDASMAVAYRSWFTSLWSRSY